MAIVITDLLSEFGNYYRPGSQALKDLHVKFFAKLGTSAVLERRITDGTRLEGGNVTQGAVVQGWQQDFTPMGDTTFVATVIELFKLKVDISMNPDQIEQSWLGFLADKGLNRKDWPIVRYIVEMLVLPQILEDYELNGIYKGVKAAVVPGTAQAISAAMNGIKKVINTHIAASETTPFTLGAVPADDLDVCEYVEEFVDNIPVIVRPYIKHLNMSVELRNAYRRGKRQKYNMAYSQVDDLLNVMDNENIQVMGHLSHTGSTKLWATPWGNGVEGIKKPGNEGVVKIEENRRMVDIMTDFYRGIGFWQPQHIYTNDVELS